MKREPLMTDAYFREAIDYLQARIAERDRALAHPETLNKPSIYARANFRDRLELLISRYSAGHPVADLAGDFEPIVAAWERDLGFDSSTPNDLAYLDDYVRSLWLLSLALIFRVDESVWHRLLACIGNEGRDQLLERLVATRSPGRQPSVTLLHPKPYALLDRAGAGPAASELTSFLSVWYKALREVGWHDAHKGPDGGGFFGYWAIEAAGVVVAFGMDDTSFLNVRHYPKDLALGGRVQRLQP